MDVAVDPGDQAQDGWVRGQLTELLPAADEGIAGWRWSRSLRSLSRVRGGRASSWKVPASPVALRNRTVDASGPVSGYR